MIDCPRRKKKNFYSAEIKLFALERRRDGKEWSEIRREIKDKFKPDPVPSIRGMKRWDQLNYDELRMLVARNMTRQAEGMKNVGLTKVAETQLNNLWESRFLGERIEYGGWRYFFELLENILGGEKFRKYVDRYLNETKDNDDVPPPSMEGWQYSRDS